MVERAKRADSCNSSISSVVERAKRADSCNSSISSVVAPRGEHTTTFDRRHGDTDRIDGGVKNRTDQVIRSRSRRRESSSAARRPLSDDARPRERPSIGRTSSLKNNNSAPPNHVGRTSSLKNNISSLPMGVPKKALKRPRSHRSHSQSAGSGENLSSRVSSNNARAATSPVSSPQEQQSPVSSIGRGEASPQEQHNPVSKPPETSYDSIPASKPETYDSTIPASKYNRSFLEGKSVVFLLRRFGFAVGETVKLYWNSDKNKPGLDCTGRV